MTGFREKRQRWWRRLSQFADELGKALDTSEYAVLAERVAQLEREVRELKSNHQAGRRDQS